MNALPKAIERMAREADQAEAALQAQMSATVEVPVFAPAPASQPAPTEPPQGVAPAPAPTEPVAPTPAPVAEPWEQRYKSLQGLFNRTTAELQASNKTLESQTVQLREEVSRLMQAQARAQEKPPERAPVEPKDVENFGSDMIEMVQRYAERVFQGLATQFGQEIGSVKARVDAIEQAVTGVSQRTDLNLEQQFYATLTALVPNWETVNATQPWLDWLSETDPVYGVPRQAALDAAFKALDPQRTANVFRAHLQSIKVTTPESLVNQTAPTSVAPSAPQPPAPRPIITQKFVETFYNDVARGRYVKREDERQRIEAEINSAAAEGRIR